MSYEPSPSFINLCDAAAAQDPLPLDAPPTTVTSDVAIKPDPEEKFDDVKFDDIVVTVEETNPIKNPPKRKTTNPPPILMTRLHSVKGTPAAAISIKGRRQIGASLHVVNYRDLSKLDLYRKIVEMKDLFDNHKASGLEVDDYGILINRPVYINSVRFINVIFSDKIKPKIALRGQPLSKNDLDKHIKIDEPLFREIAQEYNDKFNKEYGQSAFPDIYLDKQALPIHFTPINPNNWRKLQTKFNAISKKYETCVNKWKVSGNHGDFEDTDTFKSFAANDRSILYFHRFCHANPNVLGKMIGTKIQFVTFLFNFICLSNIYLSVFKIYRRSSATRSNV